MKHLQIAIGAISLAAAMSVSASAMITIAGTGLANLTYSTNGSDSGLSAGYVTGSPAYANLHTPNGGPFGGANQDFATVIITNGSLGASLGTLSTFITNSSVSYHVLSDTTYDTHPYWIVNLVDPSNPANKVAIFCAGNGGLGAHPFPGPGAFSGYPTKYSPQLGNLGTFTPEWSQFDNNTYGGS